MSKKNSSRDLKGMYKFWALMRKFRKSKNWETKLDGDCIRLERKGIMGEFCPLTACHYEKTGQFEYPSHWVKTLKTLGMHKKNGYKIINAADVANTKSKTRAKLKKVLGIKS